MRGIQCKAVFFNGAVVLAVLTQGHAFDVVRRTIVVLSKIGQDHGTFEMFAFRPSPRPSPGGRGSQNPSPTGRRWQRAALTDDGVVRTPIKKPPDHSGGSQTFLESTCRASGYFGMPGIDGAAALTFSIASLMEF